MKRRLLYTLALMILATSSALYAQGKKTATAKQTKPGSANTSLLWEISGKGLKKPSWLFGTFHFRNSTFMDSLPVIKEKFETAEAMYGEVVFDSSSMQKMAFAGIMKDTTLDMLLSKEDYKMLGDEIQRLSGIDISLLKNFSPVMIGLMLDQYYMTEMMPKQGPKDGELMDLYFQSKAKEKHKTLGGLETVDEQLKLLLTGSSYKEQAKELVKAIKKDRAEMRKEITQMITCYNSANLDCLYKLLTESDMSEADKAGMLKARNDRWLKQLPALMEKNTTFIAVGALHLAGEEGLVNQLKKMGYTVKPVAMK